MGTSWAAFLGGAFEPGRRVAIDKPPVDLWLQVASTRLFGFDAVALLLPVALGGVALVAALMWLLRTILGRARRARRRAGAGRGALGGDRRAQRHDGRGHGRARRGRRRGGRARGAGRAPVAAGRGGRAARPRLRGQARRGAAADRRGGAAVARRRPARAASAAGRPRAAGDHVRGHGAGLARGRDRGPAASAAVGAGRLGRLAVARRARLQRDRAAAARQHGVDRAAPSPCARRPIRRRSRRSRWRGGRASTPPRWRAGRPPPGPLRLLSAHAHLGALDRLRGRRRTGGARRRAGAAALARARPRGPRRAADARALARRRRRAVQRDAGPAPALPGLPGSRGGGVPGSGSRPRRAGTPAARAGAPAPRCCARSSCSHWPRRWPPCATAPRRRGAPGRCRRRAWPRCRPSCARTRPGRSTRSRSARRPRPGR